MLRRYKGATLPLNTGRNDPCFCGSGKNIKKFCEKYSFILKRW
ncbi:SEC-C metal-binding domain-containing protein [Candidatus Latescibacterota bacterium]